MAHIEQIQVGEYMDFQDTNQTTEEMQQVQVIYPLVKIKFWCPCARILIFSLRSIFKWNDTSQHPANLINCWYCQSILAPYVF